MERVAVKAPVLCPFKYSWQFTLNTYFFFFFLLHEDLKKKIIGTNLDNCSWTVQSEFIIWTDLYFLFPSTLIWPFPCKGESNEAWFTQCDFRCNLSCTELHDDGNLNILYGACSHQCSMAHFWKEGLSYFGAISARFWPDRLQRKLA